MATKKELLTSVENAINARLTGGAVSSYAIGDRNLRYMSLDELRAFRKELMAEISAQEGSRNYAGFKRPA